MRQKKIFKRRHNRHPVKWMMVALGLTSLTVVSFSAGVQFGQLDTQSAISKYANMEVKGATKVAHQSQNQ